jgi:hypothetical protein
MSAINADSAVPADAMSEEQTFRSQVGARRALPLTLADIDHRWLKMKSKTYNGAVRSRKDFEIYSWVPSLRQVCASLKGP